MLKKKYDVCSVAYNFLDIKQIIRVLALWMIIDVICLIQLVNVKVKLMR